jgi:hypothetical protein
MGSNRPVLLVIVRETSSILDGSYTSNLNWIFRLAVIDAHNTLHLTDQIKYVQWSKQVSRQLHITSSVGGLLDH